MKVGWLARLSGGDVSLSRKRSVCPPGNFEDSGAPGSGALAILFTKHPGTEHSPSSRRRKTYFPAMASISTRAPFGRAAT